MSALITSTSSFAGVRLSARPAAQRSGVRVGTVKPRAEGGFDLFKLAGGRSGLNAGEKSLKTDEGLKDTFAEPEAEKKKPWWQKDLSAYETEENPAAGTEDVYVGQGRYLKGDSSKLPKKEDVGFFLGATGGFAGGEEGVWALRETITKNKDEAARDALRKKTLAVVGTNAEMSTPMLMPGMNAIVTNPKNYYHNFTGIVQRVTDGKAMLIFEGGNWDKSVTISLNDLAKSAQGPPAVNPKSAILEEMVAELKALDEAANPPPPAADAAPSA